MTALPGRSRPLVRAWRLGLALLAVAVVSVVVVGYLRPLATLATLGRLTLRASGFERRVVEGPRGRLVHFRGGDGSLVVLLHGANDQAGAWARVAGPLAARHRVLIPDLPGHGESGPAAGPLGMSDVLAGVEALMEAEAHAGRAALVGNSMGGWLALLYAQRHPERVSRVVLVNGAGLRGDGSEAKVNLLPKTREEARATMAAVTSPASGAVPDFVLDDLVRRAPASPLARIMAVPFADLLLDGRLAELQTPVTLLWGADDRILPVSYARRVASQLKNARLETIPACGHIPQRECAPRLLELLLPVLAMGDAS